MSTDVFIIITQQSYIYFASQAGQGELTLVAEFLFPSEKKNVIFGIFETHFTAD